MDVKAQKRIVTGLALSFLLSGALMFGVPSSPAAAADGAGLSGWQRPALRIGADAQPAVQSGRTSARRVPQDIHLIDACADAMGLERDELKRRLAEGDDLSAIAEENGWTVAELRRRLLEERFGRIERAVRNGLNAEHAREMKEQLRRHVERLLPVESGQRSAKLPLQPDLEQLADRLGMTKAELIAELKAGRSLADVALSRGVDRERLIASIRKQLAPRIGEWIERKRKERNRSSHTATNS